MKLLRYEKLNKIYPAILDKENNIRDVSKIVDDWNSLTLNDITISKIQEMEYSNFPIVENNCKIAPCVGNVGKIVCIGLNYSDHAAEINIKVPTQPIVFMKATSAINGPNDDIIIPKNSSKTDWEVELAVVIGKKAKYVDTNSVSEYIFGYCIANDLSEREFQLEHGGQWVKGKSCDTFAPIGPYLVSKNEVSNPQNLKIWLELNGKKVQDSSTKEMIFDVDYLVSYLSRYMSLNPGDIIFTGSPPGVGFGMNPQVFLKEGDMLRSGIEGLGIQKQKIVNL